MVIGGFGGYDLNPVLSDVEVVTLNFIHDQCDPRDLGYKICGHASIASSMGAITCGGNGYRNIENEYSYLSNCSIQTIEGEIRAFPSMARKRNSFGMADVNETLYAIGGLSSYNSSITMETINIRTGNQWEQETMPFTVFEHCVVDIDAKIFVIGGRNEHGGVTSYVSKESRISTWSKAIFKRN